MHTICSSVRIGTSDLKMLVDSFLYPANKWLTVGSDWIISGSRIVYDPHNSILGCLVLGTDMLSTECSSVYVSDVISL